MRCPFCKRDDDKVVDSRSSGDGTAIRRRRECQSCGRRYTTYETIEEGAIRVV
ncbi:MAG TPA: transcriptional regulator NrdR, partial [Planctomycetota bacterium]|nr:transcriptional regulator NrdR [Planctomycetota bacterium]